jgi:RNA polymerase sigma-70 factor, ECF subfamily
MDTNGSELLELLAADLDSSFIQLVLRYQQMLYAFALRLCGDLQDAEDIVQEVLLGAYISLTHYEPERIRALKLRAWLYKLTLNVFRNRKRRLLLQVVPNDLFEEETALKLLTDENERPEALYEQAESLQELAEMLNALPEHHRVVIICYYFEEFSYQEIATLLDQPLGTIKSRLHRGIQILRQKSQLHKLEGGIAHEL